MVKQGESARFSSLINNSSHCHIFLLDKVENIK